MRGSCPPGTLLIDNDLQHHRRLPGTRREGWKCKDRAQRGTVITAGT